MRQAPYLGSGIRPSYLSTRVGHSRADPMPPRVGMLPRAPAGAHAENISMLLARQRLGAEPWASTSAPAAPGTRLRPVSQSSASASASASAISPSLSAAGRLHTALLPSPRAPSPRIGGAAADGAWRSSEAERRPMLPYGCTMVDSAAASVRYSSSDSSTPRAAGRLKCDKCDGKHATEGCPYFKKERDNHPDALLRKATGMGGEPSDGSTVLLTAARVQRQPGDGNCLFHSLAYGLGGGATAGTLRRELTSFIERNGNMEIAGTPLQTWVKWDSGATVTSYARRMAACGCWGGGIELAVVSKLKEVNVSVFEAAGGGSSSFKRIGQFVNPAARRTIHVLYRGGARARARGLVPFRARFRAVARRSRPLTPAHHHNPSASRCARRVQACTTTRSRAARSRRSCPARAATRAGSLIRGDASAREAVNVRADPS